MLLPFTFVQADTSISRQHHRGFHCFCSSVITFWLYGNTFSPATSSELAIHRVLPTSCNTIVPRHNLDSGSWAFRVFAPRIWNTLPCSFHPLIVTASYSLLLDVTWRLTAFSCFRNTLATQPQSWSSTGRCPRRRMFCTRGSTDRGELSGEVCGERMSYLLCQ